MFQGVNVKVTHLKVARSGVLYFTQNAKIISTTLIVVFVLLTVPAGWLTLEFLAKSNPMAEGLELLLPVQAQNNTMLDYVTILARTTMMEMDQFAGDNAQ